MSNPDSRPLPEGWVTQFNEEHKVWFYINTRAPAGPVSQWTHPADDAPPSHSYSAPSGAPPRPGGLGEKSSYTSQPVQSEYEQARSESYQPAYGQSQYGSNSPAPQMMQPPPPQKKGLGGFLDKLKNKSGQQHHQPQYGGYGQQGGYPQQQQYGGYPQQQQYGGYPQQGMYGQQPMMGGGMMGRPPRRQGMGAGQGAALGLGGGLLGGMMIGNMMGGMGGGGYGNGYEDGYEAGGGGDDFGGDDGGGGD